VEVRCHSCSMLLGRCWVRAGRVLGGLLLGCTREVQRSRCVGSTAHTGSICVVCLVVVGPGLFGTICRQHDEAQAGELVQQ